MHLWKVWPIFIVGTHSRNTMWTASNNAHIITGSLVRKLASYGQWSCLAFIPSCLPHHHVSRERLTGESALVCDTLSFFPQCGSWGLCFLVRSFVRLSLLHWFIGSLIYLIYWFISSLVRCFIGSLIDWFVDCFIDSLVRWFVASLSPWPVNSLMHCFIYSVIDSLIH